MRQSIPWGRAGRIAILLAGAVISPACGTYRVPQIDGPDGLAWPAEEPRVRLEEIIPLAEGSRGRTARLVRRLADRGAPSLFRRPYAVAWDDDDLVIADPDAGRVGRIDARGRVRLSPEGLFEQPIGIAVCDAGIVVSDSRSGRLGLLQPDLELQRWLAEGLARPTGVACLGDQIYVSETGAHRIVVLDADGSRRTLGRRGAGPGEFNFPTSLAFDGSSLLVADALNFRIQRIEPETGRSLATFGALGDAPGEMPRMKGVTVDSAGNLWVADGHLDRVSLYDAAGTFLVSIGGPGAAAGEFSFPAGVAAHADGRVVVVDSLNRRLQVLRLIEPPTGRDG